MKKLLERALSQLAVLSMISISFLPVCDLSAYAKNGCCEEEECCAAPACDSNVWCWIGGALLGAAAGAGTGYAASQDGRRGRTGDPGPTGPAGLGIPGPTGATGATGAPGTFAFDAGETLTFNSAFTVAAGVGGTVTPYVSEPDGTVTEGTPVVIAALGAIVFPPIVITDPEFGEYNFGIQIDSTVIAVTGTLTENIVASRDASTTLVANATPVVSNLGTQSQTSEDFVYGPTNVP